MFNRIRKRVSEELADNNNRDESAGEEIPQIEEGAKKNRLEEVTSGSPLVAPEPVEESIEGVNSELANELDELDSANQEVNWADNLPSSDDVFIPHIEEEAECEGDGAEAWAPPEDSSIDEGPVQEPFAEDPVAEEPDEDEYESDDVPPPHRQESRTESCTTDLRRVKKKPATGSRTIYTPEQRLLILDTWRRSGLPAGDFAELVQVSKHTLYKWKTVFERLGPEGLMDQPRKRQTGSRLSEVTVRTILMLKEAHPEWGVERISDMLVRGPALSASPSAILRVLREAGYESVKRSTSPNRPPKVKRFERAKPNQLWQTDFFTFMLKRQNRRLHLIAFMDDHSRFIVCYGLHASATTNLAIEAVEAGIANFGPPEEILTDNGPQYITWRGKSRFTRHLETRGIKQIVARPKRPQTLGKIERFWGTLWRELLEGSVFIDLTDARTRVGHFIDYYNFQRPHRGIKGLVPADRYFGAAQEVLQTLKRRVAANALELAQHGKTKPPFYVTGQVSGQTFSVHSEGERLVLNREGQQREEIELAGPSEGASQETTEPSPVCPQGIIASGPGEPADQSPLAPGQSAIDQFDAEGLNDQEGGQS